MRPLEDRIAEPWGDRTPYAPGQEWCRRQPVPGRIRHTGTVHGAHRRSLRPSHRRAREAHHRRPRRARRANDPRRTRARRNRGPPMTAFTPVLEDLHAGEQHLERALLAVAERHRTDHEIRHVATDAAHWSHQHAQLLAATAPHYGLELAAPDDDPTPGPLAALREKTAEALGRRTEPGLLLLHDLRDLHLAATENSLHWEILAQAAQAAREQRLLDLATTCHPQTLRQVRWTNTMIKTLAPQILTAR